MNRGRTIAFLGPTGVGKTSVAVELAGLLGVRIISCDSMQVYEGFPVLTNQPRRPEERRDLHELVGFLDPARTMSAGEYAALATPLAEGSIKESGTALIVGGSGLYMRAAVAPLDARAPADPGVRSTLEARAKNEGSKSLHGELANLDPEAAKMIDPRNVRRVIRALEGVLTNGSKWSGRDDLWRPEYHRPTLIVGLVADRALLAAAISLRSHRMLEEGALEEVERFREKLGKGDTRPGRPGICSAIGYKDIVEYLDGDLRYQEALERMSTATRRYARRQSTWLRKVRDAVMIDVKGREPAQVAEEIAELAEKMVR